MQRRDRGLAQSLGVSLTKRVKESRVLLVGAGGIGCEVLKNLVCCGFGSLANDQTLPNGHVTSEREPSITETGHGLSQTNTEHAVTAHRKPGIVVVDLDTIDLSNLNRQFLFRKQHVKKSKAFVAEETASQFNPAVAIEAHHASIFDSKYNVEFFEGFDIVFNALDNLAARRHVNKMCLAANTTLIESGTTGFNGQVQVIRKGVTECYDCNEKPVQKSFPICTIRSTPSQPIHCIVWAKSYLLPELFGTSEDSTDVAVTENDNAEEVAKLKEEAEALKRVRTLIGKSEFTQAVFDKVFHDDIERLRSMTEMWQSRKAPASLRFEELIAGMDADIVKHGQSLSVHDQAVWTLHDNLAVFCYAVDTLSNRAQAGEAVIEFDKDDKDTLDFVASAANLRSHVFGIPLHSKWDIKQMAGNIIPAIATSNALTASLCVLEAFKILRSQHQLQNGLSKPTANNHLPQYTQNTLGGKDGEPLGSSKLVFLTSRSTERMITSQSLAPPRSDCPVCSPVYAKMQIAVDAEPTVEELVNLLRDRIGYDEFSITADVGVFYDPDLEDNLSKPLREYTGAANSFLTVVDDSDEPKVDLVLSIAQAPSDSTVDTSFHLIPSQLTLPSRPKKVPDIDGESEETVMVVRNAGSKRKRDADEEVEGAKKRARAAQDAVDAVVLEDDGAIVIDD